MMDKIIIKLEHSGIQNPSYIMERAEEEVEKHNKKGVQAVKDLLDMSIETRTLITLVSHHYRNFGKSTALADKARELGATLVVPRHCVDLYDLPEHQIKAFPSINSVMGVSLTNGKFLVDEGVEMDIIKELSIRNEFLGGFSRL